MSGSLKVYLYGRQIGTLPEGLGSSFCATEFERDKHDERNAKNFFAYCR